ncbi:hypothetical protein [Okeania sp. KiyG1]|uniref:hypothetical protein n=1 Tax=Okeania sp. KiyG1 TaxID=2720165 RepID=UPI00192351B3|nr:hypothetical protein [Okeania sp. KiyG1]GGA13416.1 hypothetical protein CYANOKiyG1_26720 [Okeania sp. KiyG1]
MKNLKNIAKQNLFVSKIRSKIRIVQKIQHLINRNKILSHQLIFCINSGRSGSNYLSALLGTAEEVVSYHEPKPSMTHQYLKMINKSNYTTSF